MSESGPVWPIKTLVRMEDKRRELAALVMTLRDAQRAGLLSEEQADRLEVYERWLADFDSQPTAGRRGNGET